MEEGAEEGEAEHEEEGYLDVIPSSVVGVQATIGRREGEPEEEDGRYVVEGEPLSHCLFSFLLASFCLWIL